jgi:hypothetical protein
LAKIKNDIKELGKKEKEALVNFWDHGFI